jgi:hypothetical protein
LIFYVLVEVLLVEQNAFAENNVRDSPGPHQRTDEPNRAAEIYGGGSDIQQTWLRA